MSEWRIGKGLAISLGIFVISIAIGVAATVADPKIGQNFLTLFKDAVAGEIIGDSPFVLFGKLFLNNIQACIFLFIGGATFGILSVFILTTNGLIIGSVVELVRENQGTAFIIAALLPHGIFEIPSFLISGALGFTLARAIWDEWKGTGDAAATAAHLGKIFVLVVVPLVLLAAFVEAFITPEIINLVT